MAEFYPSEVARLVLGYLDDVKCLKSWQAFLDESGDLQEHNRLLKAGKFCSTNVNGKSLLGILAEYCILKKAANDDHTSKLSTPSKVNGNAYTRYEINQKIQTRSFISSQTNHVPPPVSPFRPPVSPFRSPASPFRSPASRPTNQTLRRRLECQSTQLNFYKETDSVNHNASNTSSAENVLKCNSSPVHSARRIIYTSPVISKDNTCYADSSISSVSPKVNDKNTKKVSLLPNRSPLLVALNSSQPKLPSSSKLPKTPDETSNELKNSCVSRTERNESSTPTHSTPNENLHLSTGNTEQTSEFNIGSVADKQNVSSGEAVMSVNQSSSVVCLSSEVTASATESHEVCLTPQYDANPPPYNRAPLTDSPRIVLSHDRSLVASLSTPMKDKRSWAEEEWSPKRKGSLPRRRLISESPQSKYVQQPDAGLTFDTVFDNLLFGPENEFTEDDPIVQLLKDNINIAKQSDMQEECHGQSGSLDNVVKNATELTGEKIQALFLSIIQNKESNVSSVSKSDDAKCLSNTSELVNRTKTTDNIICDKNFTGINEELPENFMDSNQSDMNLNSDAIPISFNKVSAPSENILRDVQSVNSDNYSTNVQPSTDVQQMHNSLCNNSQANNLDSNYVSGKQADSFSVNPAELITTFDNLNSSMVANSGDFQSVDSTTNAAIKNASIVHSASENPAVTASDINANNNVDSSVAYNSQINETAPVANAQNISLNDTTHGEMNVVQANLSNQPNNILEVPLPIIPRFILPTYTQGGLVQKNVYTIIFNTPIGDTCLPLPAIPATNLPSPIVLNSIPTKQSTAENLVTVSENIPVADEVTISTKSSARVSSAANTTKTCNRASKRGKPSSPGNAKKRKTDGQDSQPKRKNTSCARRKITKRKLIPLFSDPTPEVPATSTPVKNSDDNIPVLSIPDAPCNSDQSSAFKLLSQITGHYEDRSPVLKKPDTSPVWKKPDTSPVLKSLMSNAGVLSNKGPRLNFSHVRMLDFTSASDDNNNDDKNDECSDISDKSSEVNKDNEASVPKRRSSRIQNKKILKTYERKKLKNYQQAIKSARANNASLSVDTGNSAKTPSNGNLNSSIFSKTLDVLHCSEDNMQISDDVQIDNLQISSTEKSDAETTSKNMLLSNETQIEPQTNAGKNSEECTDIIELPDNGHSSDEDDSYSAHEDDSDYSVELTKKPRRRNRTLKSSSKRIGNDKFCADKSKTRSSKNSKNPNSQRNDSSTLPLHDKESLCINYPMEKMENKSHSNNFVTKSASEQGFNRNTGEKVKDVSEMCSSPISLIELSQSNEPIQNEKENSEKRVAEMAVSFVGSSPNASKILTEDIKITADSNAKNVSDIDVMQNKDINANEGNSCSIVPECNIPTASAPNSKNIITPGKSDLTKDQSLSVLLFGYDSLDDESPAKMKNHRSPHPSSDLSTSNSRKLNCTNMARDNSEDLKSRKTHRCNLASNNPLIKSNTTKSISAESLTNDDTIDITARNNNERAFTSSSSSSGNKNSSPSRNNDKVCNSKQYKEKEVISPMISSKTVSFNSPVSERTSDSTPIEDPEPVSNMSTNSAFNINSNTKKSAIFRKPTERKTLENVISFCKDKENAKRQQNSKSIISLNEENARKENSNSVNKQLNAEVSVGKSVSNISSENTSHDSVSQGDIAAKEKNLSKSLKTTCLLKELLNDPKSPYVSKTSSVTNLAVSQKQVMSASTAIPRNESNCSSKIYTENVIDKNLHNKSNSSNLSFSVTNNKIAQPPKKRIKPIPVDSSSNESFGPFIHFLPTQNSSKARVSPCLGQKDSHKKCDSSIVNYQTREHPNKIASELNNISDYEILNSNPLTPLSHSLSPLKQFQVVPAFKSPVSKIASKCAPPSPSTKSASRSSYLASGKPKAMADFYKNAFPYKSGELPISPISFSSSSFSCTGDAFLVKRNLQGDNTNLFDKNEVDSIHVVENICDLSKNLHEENDTPEVSCSVIISENPVQESQRLEKINIEMDPEENNAMVLNTERKRKISESCSSDSCSTVVDLSDSEIMTPMKGDDWLNKDVFCMTPYSEKITKSNDTYTDSDVSPDSSPEKVEHNRLEFANISSNRSPVKVGVNEPNHLSNVNVDSVDPETRTADNVPLHKVNVNEGKNINKSSMNHNVGTISPVKGDDWSNEDVFCKDSLSEKRKRNIDIYTDSDVSSVSSLENVELSRDNLRFSNISSDRSPVKVGVNDSSNLCDINVNSVDPMKRTADNVPLHKTNVNENKNVKSTLNHNVGTKSKACKNNNKKSRKNSNKTESKSSSKQGILGRANKSYSDSDELGHNVKKSSTTHDKRERQSRPTLKIASLKSPCENQANGRNNDSPKTCENKTLKKKITAPKLQNGRNKGNLKKFTDDKGSAKVKITGNKFITCALVSETEVAKFIPENKIRKSPNKVAEKLNASLGSTKPIGNIDQCESTRDIVESDIGRSNEEGSELFLAIASVQRELQIPQPDHDLCPPRLEASSASLLNVEEKVDADAAQNNQKGTEKIKHTPMSMDNKVLERLMSKIKLHGWENVRQELEGLSNSEPNKK